MTGTIKRLNSGSGSGVITAQDGMAVNFCPSAVMAYDLPVLAVGQVVSFDLEAGRCPKALNVVLQRTPQDLSRQPKRLEITRLRYIGFEHKGNMRAYLFERVTPGAEKRTFTVDADLALFTKHRVGMQEGPGICLHLLAAELEVAEAAAWTSSQCALTDLELLAYLASRPVPRAYKQGAKHALPAPGAVSHAL